MVNVYKYEKENGKIAKINATTHVEGLINEMVLAEHLYQYKKNRGEGDERMLHNVMRLVEKMEKEHRSLWAKIRRFFTNP